MFTAALFIIVKNWKQLRCRSTSDLLNKLQNKPTPQNTTAIRRNQLLVEGTTWMDLKGILSGKKPILKGHTLKDSIM